MCDTEIKEWEGKLRKGDSQRKAAVEKRSEKWKAKKKRKEH